MDKKTGTHWLSERLGLPEYSDMQDWGLQVSDGNRIQEFLSRFEDEDFIGFERVMMFELILHSYEDALNTMPRDRNIEERIAKLYFNQTGPEKENLRDSVKTWLCPGQHEDLFNCTQFLRSIFEEDVRKLEKL